MHWVTLPIVLLGGLQPGPAVYSAAPCEVQLLEVATLSGPDVGKGIVRSINGYFWLVPNYAPFQVTVLDSSSRVIRTVGRHGSGPQEFNRIRDVIPLGQEVAIVQADPPRMTVLDSSGKILRSHPLPILARQGGVAAGPGTTILIMGDAVSPSHFGRALVQIDSSGSIVGEFGHNVAEKEGPLRGRLLPRLITYGSGRGPITVKRYAIDIEQWNWRGDLVAEYRHDADWFHWPPPLEYVREHRVGPPENRVVAVDVDEDGRLWLVAHVTPKGWQDGVSQNRVVDEEAWIDSRIEVLDLKSRSVVCSQTLDSVVLHGFVGPGHIATYHEDEIGNPSVTIWALSLRP